MLTNIKTFINNFLNNRKIPTGVFRDINDFKTNYSKDFNLLEIKEETKIKLTPPKIIKNELHGNFHLDYLLYPADYLLELYNENIYGEYGLIVAENIILNNFNIQYDHLGKIEKSEIFSKFKRPQLNKVNGTIAVMTSLWADFYYHWMLEVLPKFHILKQQNINPNYYLFNISNKKFQNECLEKLGIPQEKIIYTSKNTNIQAEKIIVPSIPGATGHNPLWAIDYTKSLFQQENMLDELYSDKIFISRKKAHSRKFVNEEDVEKILKEHGFKETILEDLDIYEQAKLFYNAKIIFSPHGGGLTNLIFCRPKTKVIEIFSPAMPNPCYWTLCNTLNIDNYHLMAKAPDKKIKLNGKKFTPQDIILDIQELKDILKLAS